MLNYTSIASFPNAQIAVPDLNRPKISVLSKEHVEEVTELLTRIFTESEPLCKHLGITYDEFLPFAKEVVKKAAKDKLSVVAINPNGKIIGCVIGEDINHPLEGSRVKAVRPITSMFMTLSKPFIQKKFKDSTVVHIWVTAVLDEVRGHGLSTLLNSAAVSMALQKGYSYVFAEFTNEINERIMQHFPDHIKCEMKLKDFIFEGKRPFVNFPGKASSYICSAAPFISIEDLEKFIL